MSSPYYVTNKKIIGLYDLTKVLIAVCIVQPKQNYSKREWSQWESAWIPYPAASKLAALIASSGLEHRDGTMQHQESSLLIQLTCPLGHAPKVNRSGSSERFTHLYNSLKVDHGPQRSLWHRVTVRIQKCSLSILKGNLALLPLSRALKWISPGKFIIVWRGTF